MTAKDFTHISHLKKNGYFFCGEFYTANESGNAGSRYIGSEYVGDIWYNSAEKSAIILDMNDGKVSNIRTIPDAKKVVKCGGLCASASSYVQYYTFRVD